MGGGATATLAGAIDELLGVEPQVFADGDIVLALHRQLERLQALVTRATAGFDSAHEWENDGARSAAAWIAHHRGLPTWVTRRRVCQGRALRHMDLTEAAFGAGDINEAHVEVLVRARAKAGAAAFEEAEEMLLGYARDLRYGHFLRAVSYWLQVIDPDGTDRDDEALHAARRLHLSRGFYGSWVLDGQLDPAAGAAVAKVLKAIEEELFETDWAEARARVGEKVCAADLARTPAQRRADALVEMARRAAASPPGSRLPEPLFTVLVGYETFAGRICELADGTVVAPGSLLRWMDQAWVERVVFDSPDRVRNVGLRRRIFTGATRRAVEVRDRECFHDYCDVPAEDCEIDHVVPWAAGGPTVESNGRPACRYHNRHRHRRT